ncbi:ABC transporter permease [Brevibacillus dissolubilis]|uniref:ABC transporter permease n=1 Tax=Brevibacillus dissolubilis TaxID=1844116 RepID=UPI001115C4F9|nr:ABC transporter permease [Brevibacillus dissolubilis]
MSAIPHPESRSKALWFTASIIAFFLIWELVCRLFAVPPFILPPPSAAFLAMWTERELLFGKHLWVTTSEVILGLTASIICGVAVALAMSVSRPIERLFYPYVVISQTIPYMALSPIFIYWFGYSLTGKIAITILFIFFPIVVNTFDGLRAADSEMINLLRTMGATRRQIFLKAQIPAALPSFFSGLKVAATYSVSGAIIGEWLGASAGLGYFARRASGYFRADTMFATILLLVFMGVALFMLTSWLERRFTYQRSTKP